MITERTLRKGKKEALETELKLTLTDPLEKNINELCGRILRMIQELFDLHLLKK